MKRGRKRLLMLGVVAVCLLAVASLSKPGRAALTRLFSTGETEAVRVGTGQARQDVEQRARARHGWNASLQNSIITGQITYYDREGQTRGQANIRVFRKYPDRMRVEIQRGSAVETIGFDQERAWRTGSSLSEAEARDIRAWLRLWPERLFSSRDKGGVYREASQRVEDFRPATPWQQSSHLDEPVVLEQIEIEDNAGPAPDSQRAGDRRSVLYYIERESLLIKSARWMEPDDPRRADDPTGAKMDSRVDFGNWLQQAGVMWPMEIVRWLGGRVEFRIEVSEVRVNQTLADSLFVNPNR